MGGEKDERGRKREGRVSIFRKILTRRGGGKGVCTPKRVLEQAKTEETFPRLAGMESKIKQNDLPPNQPPSALSSS
jgi:hypothetical protein